MRNCLTESNARSCRPIWQFVSVGLSLILCFSLYPLHASAAGGSVSAPTVLSEATSTRAVALDSVTFKREPFAVNSTNNFSADGRTRVMLFVMNPGLLQNEGANAVTADAQDAANKIYPLKVEYTAPVPDYEWMSQVVVRLSDDMGDLGDVLIRINIHGVASNRVRIGVGHIGGGPADDAGSVPTPAPAPPAPQPTPFPTPNSYNGAASTQDTVRFLEQTTFGATPDSITHVQQVGFRTFLNEQFSAPVTQYPVLTPPTSLNQMTFCGSPNPADPNYNPNYAICLRDNFSMYPNQVAFFKNALNGQDQLRQRVAFALSQIVVTSGVGINNIAYAMREYQQLLMKDAFANYRQILTDVTLSPTMGAYLNMVNNRKAANGAQPNENYARELMQLFSIGTIRLNQDGTPLLDQQGRQIPTYDQSTITNFARVMTGFTYAPFQGATVRSENPPNYLAPMIPNPVAPNYHDVGPKEILNGVVLPGGQTAQKDLDDTLDNVFNHPNVAPFICKQLIQHLVTSNPSPAYVGRVSAVFNNNGAGVRGDLKSVVTAILLDPEARGDFKNDPNYGKLREPILFVTDFLRAFNPTSDGDLLNGQTNGMGQNVFNSPTVFNYYSPDYQLPGATLFAPEFEIQTSAAAFARSNFINTMVFSRLGTAPAGTAIDLSAVQSLATDPAALINELDRVLMHGTMSAATRGVITTAVNSIAIVASNPEDGKKKRAQAAVYLVATSSQYQIER